MSEHEFEQFLAIFRGMLRLDPAQRDEIAAELMDHLQERLAELTARGMSRDRAVQIALEEFGDAAGLAAQFLLIVSQQRRRRIMKWTAGSVMAAMVVLYGAYAFWPAEPARGPGSSPAVAQEQSAPTETKNTETKKKKKDSAGKSIAATLPKSDAIQEVETRLAEKMAAKFNDVPLQDFLDAIGAGAKVDFYLDKKGLDEAGVGTDSPVNINLKNIRIDKLLDLVLGQLDLVWISREDYVFISTRQKLADALETRVYNCRDLVELSLFGSASAASEGGYGGVPAGGGAGMPGTSGGGHAGMSGMSSMPGMGMSGMGSMGMMPGGMPAGGMGLGGGSGASVGPGGLSSQPYMGTLIEVITSTVMPESWTPAGGPGSVAAYHGGLLVVNHHPQAHQKIDQLLRMLREASKDRPGTVVRER